MAEKSTKPTKKAPLKKTGVTSDVLNSVSKSNKLSNTKLNPSKRKVSEKIVAVKKSKTSESSSKTKQKVNKVDKTKTEFVYEILDLVKKGIVFDLYGNPELLTSYKLKISKLAPEYRSHLFIFPLKSNGGGYHDTENNYNTIIQVLSKKLKKGFQDHIFPPFQHSPIVGIFNSVTNQFIAFGLGRKNRSFVFNAEGLTGKQEDNYLKKFKKYDVAGRIDSIFSNFEELGNIHRDLEEDVEDWENLTDDQIEMQEDIEYMIESIKEDIPTLSGEISDISPCDFA
jgi:hypothetical protein